ncbi:MAG: serine hydrolase [Verrucomicrobia bacterium]|nr:serine hydrolase [Verrucomicrobiota bacterium]MBS0636922.1 serine hydrolase [Verrucomicrobiota bacterium]
MKNCVLVFVLFTNLLSASSFDEQVLYALKKYEVPGAAVAIVTCDSVELCKGYGEDTTEYTQFGIGSCTKAFTALLLEQLIDEGRADWHDPVLKFLPNFRLYDAELTKQVTLLDLISHKTAISRNDPLWVMQECPRDRVLELLPHFLPAGEYRKSYIYNNFMYEVVGLVIEAITGNTVEEEMQARIFNPLEMYATEFTKSKVLPAACGITSSAHDMAKWLQLHLRSEVDNPRYQVANSEGSYARGWKNSGGIISHGGLVEGYVAEVLFIPEQKIGIAILTNSSKGGHYVISAILHALLDIPERDYPTERPIVPSELDHPATDYSGSYYHPAYGTVLINDQLELMYANERVQLYPTKEDSFVGRVGVLMRFGMPSVIPFTFVRTHGSIELHIPFEGFYDPAPVCFKRS